MILKKTGWYISTSQFASMWGEWFTSMVYVHDDRTKIPLGAFWHEEGEEVNAEVQY